MLTFTRESAEEESGAAEIALEELLDNAPIIDNSDLVQLEARHATEMAQLTSRNIGVLHRRYDVHRTALADLKAKQSEEISELQAGHREAKFALASVHAEQKSELQTEKARVRLEYSAKLKAARQRVKNADTVLRQLTRVGR